MNPARYRHRHRTPIPETKSRSDPAALAVSRRKWLGWIAGLAGAVGLPITVPARAAESQMAMAAKAFLAALPSSARKRATKPFDDRNRFDWHFFPRSREGLPIGDMSAAARNAAEALLRTGLSAGGYRKVLDTMTLEAVLRDLETFGFNRDPDNYAITLFGDPSSRQWGWRFEGHHLSLNYTIGPDGTTITPAFLGSNPARVRSGPHHGLRTLAREQDLGLELVQSLSSSQRERAVIADQSFGDILTGPGRADRLRTPEGLPLGAMGDGTRDLAMRLVNVYLNNADRETATGHGSRIQAADPGRIHFAWAGGLESDEAHYYRLHGPAVLIEFDNTRNDANHIHSVLREPGKDFGRDDLMAHYLTGHHANSAHG